MNVFKKVSLSSLMFVMVFGMSFGNFVPKAHALITGDLVKGPNSDAVYYINGSMKHVFPDKKTYMTWYTNFDAVKTVAISELDMFTTGAPVAYRPGTKLVTHPNTARVYAVEPGGKLRWIPSEAVALSLYGSAWATWVNDVHELTFGNYTIGADMTSAAPSAGTILQKTGDPVIYYFDGTNIRPFASAAAFDANNLNWDFVVKVPSLGTWTIGSSITGAETFATISGVGTGTVTGPSGSLTVALSPNTPAANGILLGGAARVPMTTVRLSAGNTAVIVDSLTIERRSIASDAEFAGFDLLDGATMLPLNDSSKTLNANHQAVFNDDFTVPANGSMDVIVAANMVADLSLLAGEYPVIAVTAMTLKNNSTLSGTLPIVGNVFLTNGTITVGTAVVAAGANNPSATTKEIGTKDYIVTSVKVSNTSSATGQNMTLKSVTFTNNGSASSADVENLRLVNSNTGTVLGTVAKLTGDKVSFINLNLPILKGNNVNLDLKLDIIGGSARTIDFDVEKQADIIVFDELRGFNALPTYPNASEPFFNGVVTTVGNGKLRIESVAVTPSNVQENTNDVLLGKFKFVVQGEPINVTRLPIKFLLNTTTGSVGRISDITNVTVKDAAGLAVVSGQDPTSNNTPNGIFTPDEIGTATTTDTITVPIGETIYSVYANLSSDFTTNDTIQTQINPLMITAKGDVSGNSLDVETSSSAATDVTPTTDVSGTTVTVRSADLNVSVASSPAAQTIVAGSQDFEVANIVLDAASSPSDVRVTQFKVPVITTGLAFPDIVNGIELFVGDTKVPVDSTSVTYSSTGSTAASSATTTMTITAGNLTVTAGQSKTVKVKVDVGTGATSGTFKVGMQTSGVTVLDSQGNSFDADITPGQGQAMTLASGGTLNIAISSDPVAALVVGGSTTNVGKFTLEAKNESINLHAFGFTLQTPDGGIVGDSDEVDMFDLWDDAAAASVGTVTVTGANATITPASPLSLSVNTTKSYTLKSKWEPLTDSSPASSGSGLKVLMSYIDARGQAVGSSAITLNGNSTAFKTFSLFESVPTVATIAFSGDNTVSGNGSSVNLFKFSVSANSAGPVGLSKFSFGISTTTVLLDPSGYRVFESASSGVLGDIVTNTNDVNIIANGAAGVNIVLETRFDRDNDNGSGQSSVDSGEGLFVSAGTSKYYTLQGTVLSGHDGTADNEAVTVVLAGDAAFAGTSLLNHAGVDGTNTGNDDFIWSDLNFGLNSTPTAPQNIGWFNGYRVSGLETTSSTAQTVTD